MELKFELPEYCEGCPMIELTVQQRETYKIAGDDTLYEIPADVYCIHELVCALWMKALEQEKQNKLG